MLANVNWTVAETAKSIYDFLCVRKGPPPAEKNAEEQSLPGSVLHYAQEAIPDPCQLRLHFDRPTQVHRVVVVCSARSVEIYFGDGEEYVGTSRPFDVTLGNGQLYQHSMDLAVPAGSGMIMKVRL